MKAQRILRPDNKGRVHLGKLAQGVSGYCIEVDQNQRIILEPLAEVPAREKWLFDNPQAMAAVKEGLKQSATGNIEFAGSFADHANDEE